MWNKRQAFFDAVLCWRGSSARRPGKSWMNTTPPIGIIRRLETGGVTIDGFVSGGNMEVVDPGVVQSTIIHFF